MAFVFVLVVLFMLCCYTSVPVNSEFRNPGGKVAVETLFLLRLRRSRNNKKNSDGEITLSYREKVTSNKKSAFIGTISACRMYHKSLRPKHKKILSDISKVLNQLIVLTCVPRA